MTVLWSVLVYRKTDPAADDERRYIPEWNLHKVMPWAARRGYDTIVADRTDRPAPGREGVTHHLCDESDCPGGCEPE